MKIEKKVTFITLGCKTNQYETNAMEQKFENSGYKIVHNSEEVNNENTIDIKIVNTCSVTNMAQRKSRQMLRKIKQKNSNAIVVACGCYAQVAKNEIQEIPEVDIILGTNEKNNIVEIIEEYIKDNNAECKLTKNESKTIVTDVMHEEQFHDFGTVTYTEQTRAVIKVQDGCDRFCSYCIIPFARGKVRSREPQNIIKEIEEIAKKGIKEVILTGIHIASYGKDFKDEKVEQYRKQYNYDEKYVPFDEKNDLMTGGFRLIELLEQINKIKEIERIRLGSIEPKLITKEFLEKLAKLNKICHHFHLSLQSGCDETLKRMNRRYSTEEFRNIVKLLREKYNDVILTTDIIVGFPGESEEEFNSTYKFLEEIKFYKMHIFKYSKRNGTKAIEMPMQVDERIKEERSKKLIELSNNNQIKYNKDLIGKEITVLFEEREDEYFKGHTANYILVKAKSDKNLQNEIKRVKILETIDLDVEGKIVE